MPNPKKTHKKPLKNHSLASKPEDWRAAPRPNYETNTDLDYPYSEYPRTFEFPPVEYHSTKLGYEWRYRILDFWGEGRIVVGDLVTGFRDSYNVNHQYQLVSNGLDTGRKIPNRIPTVDYDNVGVAEYVRDGTFLTVTLMGIEITPATAAEMARLLRKDSDSVVVIYGFKEDVEKDKEYVENLQRALDAKGMVICPLYELSPELSEVTLKPALAFRPADFVVNQATLLFSINNKNDRNSKIARCATILRSLYKSAQIQASAGKALSEFFAQRVVRDNPLIFKLGYELMHSEEGRAIISGYMNTNVAKIIMQVNVKVRIVSKFGEAAHLCPYGKVGQDSWQWAMFATPTYINGDPAYRGGDAFTLVPTKSKEQFNIRSDFGVESYLCTNGKVPAESWEWAFFGTPKWVNSPTYSDGHNFYLKPVNGGEQFMIESAFVQVAHLCTDGKVSSGSWQRAFFGTPNYLKDPTYAGSEVLSLEFL